MWIENAHIQGGELVLTCSMQEARQFAYRFNPGEYKIRPEKKKRSLDANAYAWLIINRIAEALRTSPEEVYREALRNIPNALEIVCIQNKAVDSMTRLWTNGHIGRRVQTEPSKIKGCTNMYLYCGSSDYDRRQMSQLIDNLVQDAKALDIETRPAEEIQSLLEGWE